MTVTTRYPGASSEDVELNVTNKIEEQLRGVRGIEDIISFSMENISTGHYILLDGEHIDYSGEHRSGCE
jgi:multidrug efflux pump subunit AcrB